MNRIPIAIVSGGLNEERVISVKSAKYIIDNIDKERFEPFLIFMDGPNWYEEKTGIPVDKNDFSILIEGKKIAFGRIILIIHGSPVEDGKVQGYFDNLGIQYQCCNTFTSALTFHKMACKRFLEPLDIPLARSILLYKDSNVNTDLFADWSFPLFIKPNQYGSSFGITRLESISDLNTSIGHAFEYDTEVMVEEGIEGREFGCGVMEYKGEVLAFPLTEIIPYAEYFDWDAKYENQSDEITPADLPEPLSQQCQEQSIFIYKALGCKGVIRIDYILKENEFFFLEANTTPGLSPASIIPQMARANGWTDQQLIQAIIDGIR